MSMTTAVLPFKRCDAKHNDADTKTKDYVCCMRVDTTMDHVLTWPSAKVLVDIRVLVVMMVVQRCTCSSKRGVKYKCRCCCLDTTI